jgi:putative oxidoreductase
MKRIIPIARTLLGLVFLVVSANYFVPFLPPQQPPPDALAFAIAFKGAGLLTFIKAIEIVAGLALIANIATPLAATVLAPIIVGILVFHASLAPSGLPIALALVVLELVVAWGYRGAFASILRLRVRPTTATPELLRASPQEAHGARA